MSAQSEQLYRKLSTERDLVALIGQPEDANLDCKAWPDRTDDRRRVLAKAVCGFTNATGGVVILGMLAKGGRPGDDIPDAIQSCEPIADRDAVVSEALDIILKFVEPGIAGIEGKTIAHKDSNREGYAIIHVPESESTPRRTKTDWKFYVRIASGTMPMEYFQIEDRFGRRPHPKLSLERSSEVTGPAIFPYIGVMRAVKLSIRNEGRGIARFPCLRCRNNSPLRLRQNNMAGDVPPWPFLVLDDWTSIRGGVNDVVYPGERIDVMTVAQHGNPYFDIGDGQRISPPVQNPNAWDFGATDLEVELLCEGMPPHRETFHFPAAIFKSQ